MDRPKIKLRKVQPTDSEQLAYLYAVSADTGHVSIAPKFYIDTYLALMNTDVISETVVAVHPTHGIIGAGSVSFRHVLFEGKRQQSAYLSHLVVHPAFRRQHVATRLAKRRVDITRTKYGETCLIVAGIQSGNVGSFRVTNSWAGNSIGNLESVLLKTKAIRPRVDSRFCIREITVDDFATFADRLNFFYRGYNLYRPYSAETLYRWQRTSPFSVPYRKLLVAESDSGEMVSGIAISEEFLIRRMHINNLPVAAEALNKILRVVPKNRELRPLKTQFLWFEPSAIDAAKYLWETVRWRWYGTADVITHTYDGSTEIRMVVDVPKWLPRGKLTMMANYASVSDRAVFAIE